MPADGIDFDIYGLDGIQEKIKALAEETQGRTTAFALRKAADLVRDSAKGHYQLARLDDPDTPEKIDVNIVTRKGKKRYLGPGEIAYRVGVLGGARNYEDYGEITTGKSASGNPGGDTFYWRFLEFGTENIRARPFMRPALERNVGKATAKFVSEYDKSIDRALKKAAKKDKTSF